MFAQVIFTVLIIKIASAQTNGKFWWLNDEFSKLKGVKILPAAIEYDNDFDTDESDKVLFEEDLDFQKPVKSKVTDDVELHTNHVKEEKRLVPVTHDFVFPDDKILFPNNAKPVKIKINKKDSLNLNEDKITFQQEDKNNTPHPKKNICEFMTKTQCISRAGYVSEQKKGTINSKNFICCIGALSLVVRGSARVVYPGDLPGSRVKRSSSNKDLNSNLEQRKALILRKYNQQNKDATISKTHNINQEIVTQDDDYVDPYLNIKSSNFRTTQKSAATTEEYDNDGHGDSDYPVELPRPGFLGVYSDHGHRPPSWTFIDSKKYNEDSGVSDEVDSEETFAYGAVDPRLTARPTRRGIMKLTDASSDEASSSAEKQTITYQSNPDFKVLQGFKLPNLFRNKSYSKERKSTTESSIDNDESSSYFQKPSDSSYDYESSLSPDQIYSDCGKSAEAATEYYESDKQIGEALNGSHPWLALVVVTKHPESVLCYATILHPRLAVTVADCVYRRTNPGDVSLVAGLWYLSNKRRSNAQQRMPSIYIHPQYKKGGLGHNLALLYWKRPIRFGASVQPACLSEPRIGGDDCKFFGWGGYDKEIQKHSRWQKASILSPSQCSAQLSINTKIELPQNEFCAAVDSQTSVTGMGGPLICSTRGRASVAGVAVWRDHLIVLISAREWALETFDTFI